MRRSSAESSAARASLGRQEADELDGEHIHLMDFGEDEQDGSKCLDTKVSTMLSLHGLSSDNAVELAARMDPQTDEIGRAHV